MAKLSLVILNLAFVGFGWGKVVPKSDLKQVDYRGSDDLDSEGKYEVAWEIDSTAGVIGFAVVAETQGFVGFGLSPTGAMTGADIFIAGLKEGTPYYMDWYGVGNTRPVEDSSQDWKLLRAEETDSHTKLVFSRKLNTCDDEDFEITDQTIHVIWAMGNTDDITYHNDVRGTKSINFFLPNDEEITDPAKFEKLAPGMEGTVSYTNHRKKYISDSGCGEDGGSTTTTTQKNNGTETTTPTSDVCIGEGCKYLIHIDIDVNVNINIGTNDTVK